MAKLYKTDQDLKDINEFVGDHIKYDDYHVNFILDELVAYTDFAKNMEEMINKLTGGEIEKIALLKDNKLQTVIISSFEYERLSQYSKKLNFV